MAWGVDSVLPANSSVPVPAPYREPGEDAQTRIPLFDYVARRMHPRRIEFWGRYLNRRLPVDRRTGEVLSPPGISSITPDEADFLHARGARVLLTYNGSRGRRVRPGSLIGGRRGGERAAAAAHTICEQLQVPARTVIYADVENWDGDVRWFRGWYETLRQAGRPSGVYGRPVRLVENPARPQRQYGTYLDAIRSRWTRDEARRRIAWEAGVTGRQPRRVATGSYWADELAQAMADVTVAGVLADGRDPLRGPSGVPFSVWSSEPRRVIGEQEDAHLDASDIPDEFVPAVPTRSAGIRTVVWQYLENALFVRSGPRGTVDMNLASDRGLAGMW